MTDDLAPDLRARLDALVASDHAVLFMKGTRSQPRCGFSARVARALDGHLDQYTTVDVLADEALRDALKVYTDWPTFPQLYVDGSFVGGADIVLDLEGRGELAPILGVRPPAPPAVTLTPRAADRIREVLEGQDLPLRFVVTEEFGYQFDEVEALGPNDVEVVAHGVRLVFDRASARRADGLAMDFVDGPSGPSLVVDNPNEPPKVGTVLPTTYAQWRADGVPHALIDVRMPEEWAICHIPGAKLLADEGVAWLEGLPRDTRLVFVCHHGVRSRNAAEQLLEAGFRDVWNLAGGVDAWASKVDPTMRRY